METLEIKYYKEHGYSIKYNTLSYIDPMKYYVSENHTLIIPEGVKRIARGTFSGIMSIGREEYIKEIVLPKSLEKIDEYVFFHLDKLEKINFPPALKEIGESAFKNCICLENIELNEGLKFIGNDAFESCSLEELYIPSTVTKIGDCAFYFNTELNKITVSKDNPVYSDMNCNVIYNKNTNTLIQGCNKSQVPKGTEAIGINAFATLGKIKSIKFPDSVKKICDFAFEGCNIKEIILNEGLVAIGYKVFSNCTLEELTLPSTLKAINNDIIEGSTIKKLNILCDVNLISNEKINNSVLKEIFVKSIVDKTSEFYKEFEGKISTLNIDELIEQNKSVKEINEIYKNLRETER